MTLKMIKNGALLSEIDQEFSEIHTFCQDQDIDLTFEWMNGQYWLHSDQRGENPIGIEIDKTLQRHDEFFKKSSLQKELLARAIGVKGAMRPKVLDLTGGLLGDTLLLLSFGCEVWVVERHPVIRFMILSALQNAHDSKLSQLHFLSRDAISVLQDNLKIDSIYFDPMFEDANEKTSPRKEMRIFRSLVGKDQDAEQVFQMAHSKGPKRLVVKRPRQSISLYLKPSVQYIGKSTRYDVYFSV
jgi:16S rRNA (guanine1516-N2)-methyltransferase